MRTVLIGGMLNGQTFELDAVTAVLKLPIKSDPQAWTADSYERYALGDKGANGFRYYVGSEDLQGWPIERPQQDSIHDPNSIVKYRHRSHSS